MSGSWPGGARLFAALHEHPCSQAEDAARRAAAAGPLRCVSACLLGIPCRYDGGSKPLLDLAQRLGQHRPLPLCPEVLAGLGIPRPPMAFVGGDGEQALLGGAVLADVQGRDCTPALRLAVARALRIVRAARCEQALLKERSPSCGVWQTHAREGGLREGCGMLTAALKQAGIAVESDEQYPCP